MAQLVLGAAGAYAGFLIGGPTGAQYGFAAGAALGGYYETVNKKIEGPRLTDLRVTGTEYGECIPYVIGCPRISGQVWWASEKRAVGNTTGGKGGEPQVTTYTYEVDLLIGLTDNEIVGVSRIWLNGKLVYRGQNRTDLWRRMTVYTGDAAQLPDPTYEAAVGSANAPAYRGRSSIFFEGLQIDGYGQIPNLTFEVCETAETTGEYFAGPQVDTTSYINVAASASGTDGGLIVCVGSWDTGYSSNAVNVYELGLTSGVTAIGSFSVAAAGAAATGSTDEPCYVQRALAGGSFPGPLQHYTTAGVRTDFDLSSADTYSHNNSAQSLRFAKSGSTFIVADRTDSASKKIHKYTMVGAYVASSAAMSTGITSLAVVGDQVYASANTGTALWRLDVATLTLQETITRPHTDGWSVCFDNGGELGLWTIDGSTPKVYMRRSGAWVLFASLASTYYGTSERGQMIALSDGYIRGGLVETTTGEPNAYLTFSVYQALSPLTKTLEDTVEMLCDRAGMQAGDFDATDLASITQPVRGIAISQVEPMRGTLDQLRQAYLFDAALSDKLYFRPRGASSVRTLTYEEIGAGFDGAAEEPLVVSVANDLELPPQIAVQYRNAANDYQVGTEYSDRLISGQVAAVSVQFGLGLLPAEAKKAADVIVTDAHAGIVSAQFATGIEHTDLEPADVLQVTDRAGKLLRVRIVRKRDEGGVLTFETSRDYASVIESEEITDDGYTEQSTVTVLSETELLPLDIPITRDEDNGPGYYVAARGTSSKWAGAEVRSSVNNVDFSTVATIRESAVLGTCTTTLGDSAAGAALLDMVNTVTVSVLYGELASSTRAAMFADETINVMMIGDEVVRFITATQSSSDPNVYVLSGLFRGVLGTEWAIGSHAADEECCLLRPQGLRRVSTQTSDIGVARYLKGVSLGLASSSALAESFTDTGRALKPWAPVNLRQSKSGSDYTITWDRRTRLKTRFASSVGMSVPLGEASEAYEVELLDGSDVLVDTFDAATGSVTFSGSYTGYKVRIYQISETVGRGYVSATLTLI